MKIDRDFFSLTEPFVSQSTDFVTGSKINSDVFPLQMPNKRIYLSSAEGVDSHLFDMYKLCFEKMLLGDPNYYVCDIDCTFSLHPTMNGRPMKPLITEQVVQDALASNPYRGQREYFNKFDQDGSEFSFIKRSTILKYSETYYPVFGNEGDKLYAIAYDPSSKVDNSCVGIAEFWHDTERGWLGKLVHMKTFMETTSSGEKAVLQVPEQIEMIKNIILDYNKGAIDYENIDSLTIDAGAGGQGPTIARFLMNKWVGSDRKEHIGFIDLEDPYMKLREDDYAGNSTKLIMFNFKRDKVQAYERTQMAINQGLFTFPNSLNVRGELEFEEVDAEGISHIRYEKCNFEEAASLTQMDLAKEELVSMQKIKRPNGTISFDLSPEAKSRNGHDDRSDVVAMLCNRLMELRIQDALAVEEKPKEDFKQMFQKTNTIKTKAAQNPLTRNKENPFMKRRNGSQWR